MSSSAADEQFLNSINFLLRLFSCTIFFSLGLRMQVSEVGYCLKRFLLYFSMQQQIFRQEFFILFSSKHE